MRFRGGGVGHMSTHQSNSRLLRKRHNKNTYLAPRNDNSLELGANDFARSEHSDFTHSAQPDDTDSSSGDLASDASTDEETDSETGDTDSSVDNASTGNESTGSDCSKISDGADSDDDRVIRAAEWYGAF